MSLKLALIATSFMIVALSHCVSNAAIYQPNHAVICLLNADGSVGKPTENTNGWRLPSIDEIETGDIYDYVHPSLHNSHSMFQLPHLHMAPGQGLTRNA